MSLLFQLPSFKSQLREAIAVGSRVQWFCMILAFAGSLWPIELVRASSDVSWLAYGDLRGYFEPCGCDPKTDLGGVARIASVLSRERIINPKVLVFDLGNNISPPGVKKNNSVSGIKDRFILHAGLKMQPSAALPGVYELLRSVEVSKFFGTIRQKDSSAKSVAFALVNHRAGRGPDWLKNNVADYIILPGVVVTGVIWDDRLGAIVERPLSKSVAQKLRKISQLANDRGLRKVLLYSGPDALLKRIRHREKFDFIISTNSAKEDADPDVPDRENPLSTIVRLKSTQKLPQVVQTSPGSPGILRGGQALISAAPSLQDIFKSGNDAFSAASPVSSIDTIMVSQPVTWLDRASLNSEIWRAFFVEYESTLKQDFQAKIEARKSLLSSSPYVGSQACMGCHIKEYQVWASSRHAHAFSTLVKAQKSEDAECVACHVLAADQDGGFVSIKDSPEFANVNCENCHGPRRNHITNPTMSSPSKGSEKASARDYEAACKTCHQGAHSPDFNYQEYWKKIAHGSR